MIDRLIVVGCRRITRTLIRALGSPRSVTHKTDRRPDREATSDDSGFAIVFSVLLILLVATLMLSILATLIGDVQHTRFVRKHTQTVNTGLAGLQAALNQIRAAVDTGTGAGVVSALPCQGSNRGTISGALGASGSDSYSTSIYYLTSDPSSMTVGEVVAAALACPLNTLPQYAYLVSAGSQQAIPGRPAAYGNRTVHAVYSFSTGTSTTYGGQITTANGLCWDVGASPVVGSPVTIQSCSGVGALSQLWYYRRDLSIQWMGDQSANLCLDYRGTSGGAPNAAMTLQTCLGNGGVGTAYDTLNQRYLYAGQPYQEFVFSNLNGTTTIWLVGVAANGDYSSTYAASSYTPGTNTYEANQVGDRLVMHSGYTDASILNLQSSVGAGGTAGITNGLPSISEQIVSLAYGSDCIDVRFTDPSQGLIHYACHQAPDPAKIPGNQRFQYSGSTTAPGTVSTVMPGIYSTVCMQSNGTASVALVSCVAGQGNQQWQLTGFRLGNYAGSYLIQDYRGQCLAAGAYEGVSLAACDGSANQKWNAPLTPSLAKLTGFGEI